MKLPPFLGDIGFNPLPGNEKVIFSFAPHKVIPKNIPGLSGVRIPAGIRIEGSIHLFGLQANINLTVEMSGITIGRCLLLGLVFPGL